MESDPKMDLKSNKLGDSKAQIVKKLLTTSKYREIDSEVCRRIFKSQGYLLFGVKYRFDL